MKLMHKHSWMEQQAHYYNGGLSKCTEYRCTVCNKFKLTDYDKKPTKLGLNYIHNTGRFEPKGNKVFLLTRTDLEQDEIRKILASTGYCFFDVGSSWGLTWEKIPEYIKKFIKKNPQINFIGVELSGKELYENCTNIDHHNGLGENLSVSVLEKVSDMIGVELNFYQKAVAEHDKISWILMKECKEKYTSGLINFLNTRDLMNQSSKSILSEESVLIVEEFINRSKGEHIKNLVTNLHYSPCSSVVYFIEDLVDNIVIFSDDNEFNIYGEAELCRRIYDKYKGWISNSAYYSRRGFVGGYLKNNRDEIIQELEGEYMLI